MPAYIIVEVKITDTLEYEQYKALTPVSIAAYGGKFIVRSMDAEPLEGNWKPERIVVIEFPSVEKATHWWNSEEYAPAKAIRQRTAKTKMLLVNGYNSL